MILMVRRTRKEFTPYNGYKDRSFNIKWATAFAMEELTQGIEQNHQVAIQVNKKYPQMTTREIDQILYQSFNRQIPVAIQVNESDKNGHIVNEICGYLTGETLPYGIRLNQQWIAWQSIRHIRLLPKQKWSQIEDL